MPTHNLQPCNWILIGQTKECGRLGKNQFCKIHSFYNRNGKQPPELCKNCGVATRSITGYCSKKECGGNRMVKKLKNDKI